MLLAARVAIVALTVVVTVRMHRRKGLIGSRLVVPVTAAGAVYFAVMAVRLVLGLTVLSDFGWFSTWIPTVFHLVLASMLILIGAYQRRVG